MNVPRGPTTELISGPVGLSLEKTEKGIAFSGRFPSFSPSPVFTLGNSLMVSDG